MRNVDRVGTLLEPHAAGVLMVALAKRFGGADVRVLRIAAALQGRRRYAVAAIAGSPLHERLEAAGLAVIPIASGRGDPRTLWALVRAIRRHRFGVVDAHNSQSHLWGALAGFVAFAPVRICTVHSITRYSDRGWHRVLLYESVLRLAGLLGCRFIAVSGSIRRYLGSLGLPESRTCLIPNAVDLPEKPARSGSGIRGPLGWDAAADVVVVVGRLEPVKGHRYLLQALHGIREACPGLRCLIVGDGRERAALEAEVARLDLAGIVHFAGFRSDVPALLAESDILCLPSLSEGLPYAVLEAAAHGLPMVVSAVGGMAEFLVHGETARLVPPGDAAALARELRWLAEHCDERAALGRAARDLVRRRFDPDRMVAGTLAVYDGKPLAAGAGGQA